MSTSLDQRKGVFNQEIQFHTVSWQYDVGHEGSTGGVCLPKGIVEDSAP